MTDDARELNYRVIVHGDDDGSMWAEVEQLPGLFVSAENEDELKEALIEAIGMYLSTPTATVKVQAAETAEAGRAVDLDVLVC